MINKNRFGVANDKKLLRKIGKQWVTVSALTLVLLGGGAVASSVVTHADTTTPAVEAQDTNSIKKKINSNLDKAYQTTQSASSSSVASSKASQSSAVSSQANSANKPSNIQSKANDMHDALLQNAATKLSRNFSHESSLTSVNNDKLAPTYQNNQPSVPIPTQQSQKNDNQHSLTKPNNNVNTQKSNRPLSKVAAPNHFNSHNLGDTNTVTDTIQYQSDSLFGSDDIGNPVTINGTRGSKIDITPSNQPGIPNGWQVVNSNNEITFDGQTHDITIAKIGTKKTDTINYQYNGTTVGTTTATGGSDLSDILSSATKSLTDSDKETISRLSFDQGFGKILSPSQQNIIQYTNIYHSLPEYQPGLPNNYWLPLTSIKYDGGVHDIDVESTSDTVDTIHIQGSKNPDFFVSGELNSNGSVTAPKGYYFTNTGTDIEPIVFNGKTYSLNIAKSTMDTVTFPGASSSDNITIYGKPNSNGSVTAPKGYHFTDRKNTEPVVFNGKTYSFNVASSDKIIFSGAPSSDNTTVSGKPTSNGTIQAPTGYYFTDNNNNQETFTYDGGSHTFNVAPGLAIDFHNLYSDNSSSVFKSVIVQGYGTGDSVTISAPQGYAIVNPDGKIASGTNNVHTDTVTLPYNTVAHQAIDVAPEHDGLTYNYNSDTSTIEFVNGTASDEFGIADSDIKYTTRYVRHIKFDSDIDMSHVTGMAEAFNTVYETSDGNYVYNQNLQSINFGHHFDTSHVTDMDNMFDGDEALQSLTFPDSFDTSHVTNMSDMFMDDVSLKSIDFDKNFSTNQLPNREQNLNGAFMYDIGLDKIIIRSPNTKLISNLDDNSGRLSNRNSVSYYGHYVSLYKETGTGPHGELYTLPNENNFSDGHVGTFISQNDVPSDTTTYIYKNHLEGPQRLGSQRFRGRNHVNKNDSDYDYLTNSNFSIPRGYQFVSSNKIAFDGRNHNIAIKPDQATDTINYMYNGQFKGQTTETGNLINVSGASDTGFTIGNNPTNLPADYYVVNPSQLFNYDGDKHNVAIAHDKETDTINYQLNGMTKGSHQFTGNNINFDVTNSNDPGIPNGYQLVNPTNVINYDGGTHNVPIEPIPSYFNVIEYIDNNGKGSDVGDTSAYGQRGTNIPNSVIENDIPKGYQVSQPLPVKFTDKNVVKVAVQSDNGKGDMVVGTAFLTLLYKKGNRTDGQVLRLHINGNIGDSDIVINPQDYDKPGYKVSTTKDWHIPFDYPTVNSISHGDFSRYNRENTFVYNAQPISINIDYVDTQTGNPVPNTSTQKLSDVAYDGDTIDLEDAKASNNNDGQNNNGAAISINGHDYSLNIPAGYHLAHTNNYILVNQNATKPVSMVNPLTGRHELRMMPLMKLTLGITPHFNKPTSNSSVAPKPSSASSATPQSASSASTESSSASVIPSSASQSQSVAQSTSAASNTIVPSSTAPVTPSIASSSVTSTKASSSVAPASTSSTSINSVSAIARPVTHHANNKLVAKKHVRKFVAHHVNHKKIVNRDDKQLNHQVTKATKQLNTVERHMEDRKTIIRKATHAKRVIKHAKRKLHYLRRNKRHVAHALRRITRNKVAIKHAKRVVRTAKQARPRFVHAKAAPVGPTIDKSAAPSVKASVTTPRAKSTAIHTNHKKLPQTSEATDHAGIIAIILMIMSVILAGFDKAFGREHN